jgi:ornithine carbamoyltransferase
MKRDLISLLDFSGDELRECLRLAQEMKAQTKAGECPKPLAGKSYALIFHKNSLRTRVSFEVGINQLGGHSMFLTEQDFKMGERESIADVAKVMSRYVDGILIRTFDHAAVRELAEHATVPVVNMLTDFCHPCQIVADALTIQECLGSVEQARVCYLGDGNNIAHSWMSLAARLPLQLTIGTSEKTLPDAELLQYARNSGLSSVEVVHSATEAVRGVQIVYTDVWASMGEKDKAEERQRLLRDFQVNEALLQHADPSVKVMHCLPADRGREITSDVLDGPRSIVLDQAENRLHAQKAILAMLDRWHHTP